MLTYQLRNNEVIITGYQDSGADLVIPEQIDGCPVTEIAEEAFAYQDVKTVRLPSSLRRIGKAAFAFCYDLEEIDLPEGLQKMDGTAFLLSGVKQLHLPPSLEEITSPGSLDLVITTAPDAGGYLADGTGLYEKKSSTLLSVCIEQALDYDIREGTRRIAADAFQNIHAPIGLRVPASLSEFPPQALHPFYTKGGEGRLTQLSVHPDNPVFFMDENGLWQKQDHKNTLIRWMGGTDAEIPDSAGLLAAYSMAEVSFHSVRLPAGCLTEPGAFYNSQVHFLDLGDVYLMPEGMVENNSLISRMFSSGTADVSCYDEILLQGYLSLERLHMSFARLGHSTLPEERRQQLLCRLLQSGKEIAALCLKGTDVSLFKEWLGLAGQNDTTLRSALDELHSCTGPYQVYAREMLAALLEVKASIGEEDPFAL